MLTARSRPMQTEPNQHAPSSIVGRGRGRGGCHRGGRGRGRVGRGGRGRGRGGGGHSWSPPKATKPCCVMCGSDDGKYKCPKCREPYCSVKCCREHKTKCPALVAVAGENDEKPSADGAAAAEGAAVGKSDATKKSKYLPSNALAADPLENAVKRRRMLDNDEEDSDEDEPGWRITREMMDCVDNSAWLKTELGDGGLRQLISDIDGADGAAAAQGSHHRRSRPNNFADMAKVRNTPRELALEKAKRTNPNFAHFVDRLLLTAGVVATANGDTAVGENVSLEALLRGEADEINNVQLVPVPRRGGEPSAAIEQLKAKGRDDDDDESSSDNSSSSSSADSSSSSDNAT